MKTIFIISSIAISIFLILIPVLSIVLPFYIKHIQDRKDVEFLKSNHINKKKISLQDLEYNKYDDVVPVYNPKQVEDKICFFKNNSRLLSEYENSHINKLHFRPDYLINSIVVSSNNSKAMHIINNNLKVIMLKDTSFIIQDKMAQTGSLFHVWENLIPYHYLLSQMKCSNFPMTLLKNKQNLTKREVSIIMSAISVDRSYNSTLKILKSLQKSSMIRLFHFTESHEFSYRHHRPSIPLIWSILTHHHYNRSTLASSCLQKKRNNNNNNDNNLLTFWSSSTNNSNNNKNFLFDSTASMFEMELTIDFDLLCFENGIVPLKNGSKNHWVDPHPTWLWDDFYQSSISTANSLLTNNPSLSLMTNKKKTKKIVIFDRDIYRTLENPEKLVSFIKKMVKKDSNLNDNWEVEYKTIKDLNKSKQDMLITMLNADILISPHGYQLIYAIYTKQNSAIIEIFNDRHIFDGFKSMVKSQKKLYYSLHSKPMGLYYFIPEYILSTKTNKENMFLRSYSRSLNINPDLNQLWELINQAIIDLNK